MVATCLNLLTKVTTCPVVGTLTLEVDVIADPTAAKLTFVTVTSPAAVVFKTFSFAELPSTTASANLMTCEYDCPCPADHTFAETS